MSEIILYKTPNQDIRLEMLIENETIWLLNWKKLVYRKQAGKSIISSVNAEHKMESAAQWEIKSSISKT